MIDLSKKRLPNTIEVDGDLFTIKTDYRIWLKFGELINKDKIYYKDFDFIFDSDKPQYSNNVITQLSNFYINKNEYPRIFESNNEQIIDYQNDGEFIYAEFMNKYNIDLLEVNLHWHKFQALLRGIMISYSDIMGYRGYKGNDETYNKQKIKWAIKEIRQRDERTKEIEEMLRNGGKIN